MLLFDAHAREPDRVTDPHDTPAGRAEGVLTVLLTLACWSSIPLFLNYFAKLIDPWTANGWRYGFSALVWIPALVWAYAARRVPDQLWRRALIPSLFNAVAQICFGIAPYYVDPGLMTFSLRLQIVFVTIGAALMFAVERAVIRTRGYLAGLAMVVVGTGGTLLFREQGLGDGTALGVGLAVASGALYAGYALTVRRSLAGVNPLVAFAAISQYTAVILVALMFPFARNHGADAWTVLDGNQFFWLLASAVIGVGIGHTLYYIAIARLGVAPASGVIQLQPIAVSIISEIRGTDHLNAKQWGAGLLAVCGAALMLVMQARVAARARRPLPPDEGASVD